MSRRSKTTALVGIVGSAVAMLFLSTLQAENSGGSRLSDSLIFLAQDESSIEKQVAEFFTATKGLNVTRELLGSTDDDLILRLQMGSDKVPTLSTIIDTSISARNKQTNKVTERVITIRGFYTLPPSAQTESAAAKILRLNNTHFQKYWAPGRIYLSEKGDAIVLRTDINIPGPSVPVHMEMVGDAFDRLCLAWTSYYPQFKELGFEEK